MEVQMEIRVEIQVGIQIQIKWVTQVKWKSDGNSNADRKGSAIQKGSASGNSSGKSIRILSEQGNQSGTENCNSHGKWNSDEIAFQMVTLMDFK